MKKYIPYIENKRSSIWQFWRHKLHRKVSLGQLMVPPVTTEFWFSVTMMTSSNGNIFRVTGPLCGEFTGPGEFPTQRPVTRSFDVFFDLRLNKRLSKQPWGWWFETPSWSSWRQCNEISMNVIHHPCFQINAASCANKAPLRPCYKYKNTSHLSE